MFEGWLEESRSYSEDYGETLDGRARFDLQPGHSSDAPALRRVQSPEEVSDIYANVMRKARTVDYCADLLGPNLKFHHGKVNSKLPGSATEVKWHQDFLFQPMTNDDIITCLLFLDDVTLENGPLEVIEVIKARYIPIGMMGYLPVLLIQTLLPNKTTKWCHVLAKLGLYV